MTDFAALLTLAGYLEKPELVPPERFRMSQWGPVKEADIHECGFIGCAIGHAANSGLFPRLAMRWSGPGGGGCFPALIDPDDPDDFMYAIGIEAVAVVFSTSEDVVRRLFFVHGGDPENPPPAFVADRIRAFVAGQQPAQGNLL